MKNFYLAGGTGLALQIGHRKSIDFDFFSQKSFNTRHFIIQLKKSGDFTLINEDKDTVNGILYETKVSFFLYDYPLLWDRKSFKGIKIADIKEIGLMKFTAIAGRGTKKDFIDLYWIGQNIISLEKLFSFFDKKFDKTYSLYHILKSLTYFEDAERDKKPKMLKPVEWQEVKRYFLKQEKILFDKYYNK